jgi:hypothetical protein
VVKRLWNIHLVCSELFGEGSEEYENIVSKLKHETIHTVSIVAKKKLIEKKKVKKEEIDLNSDGKKDEILWLTKSKSKQAKPERLLINVSQKAVLDFSNNFCLPGEGYGNPDDCYSLDIESKMSSKKQPLLILKSEDTMSSVTQGSHTYTYRWQDNSFQIIGATYETYDTGQMEERENNVYDINYSTGNAIYDSWVEYGEDKVKNKVKKKCSLKKPRKGELLSAFRGFSIEDELVCK